MFDQIVSSCRYLLNDFPEAKECREYLNSRLTNESQEMFQFGFYPNFNNLQALTNLVGADILKEAGLFYCRDIEDAMSPRSVSISFFENHPLVLPFRDAYGNIIAMVGRTLLSESERKAKELIKYKNTTFKKGNAVFGLYENKKDIIAKDCVYIVEGQFDVIKAVEKGFRNIVALGNAYMTPYQLSVISRYTNNIFLLLDNDEAGERGRKRALDNFGKFANIRNFYLSSDYKDVDEYLSKNDYASLEELMQNNVS